jgi:hypothetical protein
MCPRDAPAVSLETAAPSVCICGSTRRSSTNRQRARGLRFQAWRIPLSACKRCGEAQLCAARHRVPLVHIHGITRTVRGDYDYCITRQRANSTKGVVIAAARDLKPDYHLQMKKRTRIDTLIDAHVALRRKAAKRKPCNPPKRKESQSWGLAFDRAKLQPRSKESD